MASVFGYEFNNLNDLFIHHLKDLYDAEQRLTDALPLMAEAAHNPELKQAFNTHLQETRRHVQRLEDVFCAIDCDPERETCVAMKGLVSEGSDAVKASGDPDTIDAALIAAAQKVEHYEIASYGTVRTFAERLGLHSVAQALNETLQEEGETDKRLTAIAEGSVNRQAMQ